jgi:hypothetical protein
MLAEVPLTPEELESNEFSFLTEEDNMQTYHFQLGRGSRVPKPGTKTYEADCRSMMPALLRTNIQRAQGVKAFAQLSADQRSMLHKGNTVSFKMPSVLGSEDVQFQALTVNLY